jgi:hypothetical protein
MSIGCLPHCGHVPHLINIITDRAFAHGMTKTNILARVSKGGPTFINVNKFISLLSREPRRETLTYL